MQKGGTASAQMRQTPAHKECSVTVGRAAVGACESGALVNAFSSVETPQNCGMIESEQETSAKQGHEARMQKQKQRVRKSWGGERARVLERECQGGDDCDGGKQDPRRRLASIIQAFCSRPAFGCVWSRRGQGCRRPGIIRMGGGPVFCRVRTSRRYQLHLL